MRAALILAVLLPLAACGGTTRPVPMAGPQGPEAAACRSEAEASTPARNLGRQQNFDNPNLMDRLAREREQAVLRAYNDCLRRRGLVRGGGVEAVRRH